MKRSTRVIPMISALLMGGHSVSYAADDDSDGWYFSPMLSYIKADSSRQSDDEFGLLLGFGKQVSADWNIELSAALDNLDFENAPGQYKQRGLMVDGLYFFDRKSDVQTYAVVGAGVMSTDIGPRDSTNPMVNVGVGIMEELSDSKVKVRADIRYRMDMDDESIATEDEFNDFMLNVGLTIPFGSENKSARAATVTTSKDSDNDGVLDSSDRCPGTAAGVRVDDRGCKIVEKAKDGDNDGIVDAKDECPNSAAGVSVDTKGCKLQQSFVLKGVNFVTGSAVLTKDAKKVLDDVAKTLIKNSGLKVEVAGYTDDRGNDDLNQRLSQKRAESVKAYLGSSGANVEQMIAKGYGETAPIADNASAEGRAQNRRVELHILK